ncbi:MAG: N-acetylmuramoyl-L-alanine amidase [Candidatus Omnitrophica bacterium]|nr:N-acetylmuramoyl-L-alanine amidase [Candidatus Omnitrophota bacterium]
MLSLGGCATQGPHLKVEPSLLKDAKNFGGIQYVPLVKVCDTYGLECKWDSVIKKAVIKNRANEIALMAGSDRILVNDTEKKLDNPVVFNSGALFVPVSFVRNNLGAVIGSRVVEKAPQIEAPKRVTIKTVVLDPGHGGHDAGAIGKRLRLCEKHVALSVAKKVRDILQESGIKVIMTRSNDTFIPLPKRAEMANRSRADLFVSIHINASRSRATKGLECYFLSNATDDNARALEAFEDSSLKLDEGVRAERSRQLDKTLWDMALTENRRESAELAGYICDSVDKSEALENKGTRSARFYVLKYTQMPSVLVEAGYISNRYEELKLKEPKFQDRIADAVADGILRYKKEYERTEGFTKT